MRLVFGNTGEGYFPVIWILALLGVVWCVRERRALLPVWWAMILLLDTRAGSTYAAAPVAMLAGISSVHLVWPLLRRRERNGSRGAPRPIVLAAVVMIVLASIVSAASSRGIFRNESGVLTALSPRDRAGMQWMAAHTDSSARVLVLTSSSWQIDKVSEWFPVLASRTSLATVQGSEWLPHRAFYTFIARQQRVAFVREERNHVPRFAQGESLIAVHARLRSERRGREVLSAAARGASPGSSLPGDSRRQRGNDLRAQVRSRAERTG